MLFISIIISPKIINRHHLTDDTTFEAMVKFLERVFLAFAQRRPTGELW